MKTAPSPRVFDFQNPADFLSATYDHQKTQDQTLSVRKWSAQIGIKSPQILMAILKRTRKISVNLIPLLAQAMNLEPVETQYFEFMVKHSNARTIGDKKKFEIAMKEILLSVAAPVIVSDDYDIFSHWIYSAILDICNLKNVRISKDIIMEALTVKLAPALINEAIEKLLRINLLSYSEVQGFRKIEAHITSTNDVKVKSVHEYYRQTAELAKGACEIDVKEREFQCFSIALNQNDINAYKELIRDFRRKVSTLSSPNADQVYQLNIQFFPLTSAISERTQELQQ